MSAATPSRTRRTSFLVVLGALALVLSLFAGGAQAHHPKTATQIVVTAVSTPGIDVPSTPGAPESFIVRDVDFTVDVTFVGDDGVTPRPLSHSRDTRVVLSALSGPDAGRTMSTVEVPRGGTAASFDAVRLQDAANQVRLQVDAVGKKTAGIEPGVSEPFDVLKAFQTAPATSTLTGIGFAGGVGSGCEATRSETTCADLVLPDSAGVLSSQLLSLGVCDAFAQCPPDRSVVQALVDLDPSVYTHESPATLVVKCDKSSCRGGGIPSYTLTVSLTPSDPPVTATACSVKGRVDAGLDFCVDYRQSTRDNAGDTHLFLLFVQDVRVRFP